MRLRFDGHAFRPWLKYLVQFSRDSVKLGQTSGSSIALKDAYIDAVYFKKIFPRIGQFMIPFNREQLTSSSNLLLVERSIVNKEFAVARSRGIALYGILGKHVVYGAGVFIKNGVDETEEGTAVYCTPFVKLGR
jgi:phosphate-selective porin OprO/OprP